MYINLYICIRTRCTKPIHLSLLEHVLLHRKAICVCRKSRQRGRDLFQGIPEVTAFSWRCRPRGGAELMLVKLGLSVRLASAWYTDSAGDIVAIL